MIDALTMWLHLKYVVHFGLRQRRRSNGPSNDDLCHLCIVTVASSITSPEHADEDDDEEGRNVRR